MQFGEICFLGEIKHLRRTETIKPSYDPPSVVFMRGSGDYVRVTGHLTYLNVIERYCEIVDGSSSLLIDLSIADFTAQLMIGCCCQFIGELRDITEKVQYSFSISHFIIIVPDFFHGWVYTYRVYPFPL